MPDIHGLAGRSGLVSGAIDSIVHSSCFSKRGLVLFIMVTVAFSWLACEMDSKPRLKVIRDVYSRIVTLVSPPRVIRYVHNVCYY